MQQLLTPIALLNMALQELKELSRGGGQGQGGSGGITLIPDESNVFSWKAIIQASCRPCFYHDPGGCWTVAAGCMLGSLATVGQVAVRRNGGGGIATIPSQSSWKARGEAAAA